MSKNVICREIDFMGLFTACQNAAPGAVIKVNDFTSRVHYEDGTAETVPPQEDSQK